MGPLVTMLLLVVTKLVLTVVVEVVNDIPPSLGMDRKQKD